MNDTLQRFLFEGTDIRGQIVHLNQSYTTIMEQHAYPEVIRTLLGETLAASVLLGSTLKYQGQLTVQFQSPVQSASPLRMLVAKCNDKGDIRGLAQFDEQGVLASRTEKLMRSGQLVITVEPDDKVKPYQSIVPLQNQPIASNLEYYFGQSVQIPTKIWLAVGKDCAAGMLLQLLPNTEQSSLEREQFWEHAVKLGETITSEELLSLDNPTILHRLYHQEDICLFDPSSIQFRCGCSRQRMDNAVRMLGKTETDNMFAEKQVIDVTCEYCGQTFSYDPIDVAALFQTSN